MLPVRRLLSQVRFQSTTASQFRKIGVYGVGLIGASWSIEFLSKGYNVVAYDNSPSAREDIERLAASYAQVRKASGVPVSDSVDLSKLEVVSSLDGLSDVDFVQESTPENLESKKRLIADLEKVISSDVIISSSSSGIKPSLFQADAAHPERILLGHPFNPPHILPLVEICGGEKTKPEFISTAKEFYDGLGKATVLLKKEVEGHIANRLQAAIIQEALYLFREGVASSEDIDKALVEGPGLRWAIYGQFLNLHLGGGKGGLANWFPKLGPAYLKMMKDLGKLDELTPELAKEASADVTETLDKRHVTVPELIAGRDEVILNTLAARKKFTKV